MNLADTLNATTLVSIVCLSLVFIYIFYSCYLAIYTLVLHSCRGAPIIVLYTYNDNKGLSYHILSYLFIYSVLILNECRDYVTVHFFLTKS